MKRLLILGTQFELVALVIRAKERGYYTVVCDGYPAGPARQYADAAYVEDVRHIDAIVRICQKEHIDHIVTSFSDIMFECMVLIADRAHLPCYLKPAQLDAYRQKDVCKRICRDRGIAVPRYARLKRDFSDSAIDGFHYPAILKPTDSYGSRGMKIVRSVSQVRQAFEESSRYSLSSDEVILEEISPGQELNCMGFMSDGKVTLLSISDRMSAPLDDEHIRINYAQHYPSTHFDEVKELVTEALQTFANATGQKEGPICTQCFYNGQRIEICEMVGRLFGFEHELVTLYTGLDMEDLLLDMLYEPETLQDTLSRHDPEGYRTAYGIYLTSVKEGRITDQSSLRKVSALPGVVDTVLFYQDEEICGVLGPRPYFARYYLTADNHDEALRIEKQILCSVSAKGEAGEELLFLPRRS